MGKITGNKGEWSELYAFLKILSENRIYGADGNLNRREDVYYDVSCIIRDEGDGELHYSVSEDGLYVEVKSGDTTLARICRDKVIEEAEFLLENIRSAEVSAFSRDRTEDFMGSLKCRKLKAPSKDKSDIIIRIHDYRTGMKPTLRFSIKSNLGHLPTLLNPGRTTNFIYKLEGEITDELIEVVNGTMNVDTGVSKTKTTLAARYNELISAGVRLTYVHTECPVLEDNLRLINYVLPQVVAEMLKLHYIERVSLISKQVDVLSKRNFLKYRATEDHAYYEYMIKKLLTSYALGMQSATPWSGIEDASGGYLIVRLDGEVLCFHLYNRNDFEDYLIRNTKLDTPSTSRYGFSKIFKGPDDCYYLKLNLQIRFI